jgi:hypothetical protein
VLINYLPKKIPKEKTTSTSSKEFVKTQGNIKLFWPNNVRKIPPAV